MPEIQQTLSTYPGADQSEAYEYLNACTDPEGRLEQALNNLAPFEGRVLLDIGAGSGFHAARYAALAKHVFALEPDPRLLQQMFARFSHQPPPNVSVLANGADSIPLAEGAVEVVIARFAYFFGNEACLPGMRQVKRVLAPGGSFFIIDANPDQGQFGKLARQAYPDIFHPTYTIQNRAFYYKYGFRAFTVNSVFRAPSRDVLRMVFQMDYPYAYEFLLEQVEGAELSYTFSVYHYQKPLR